MEVNTFRQSQTKLRSLLDDAESYLVNYSIEGMDSQLQNRYRENINKASAQWEMLNYMNIANMDYTYIRGINQIIDELDIYVNDFESENYPANAENLGYMNNLLKLISELHTIVNSQLYEVGRLQWNFNVDKQIETMVNAQIPVLEKNTWQITDTTHTIESISQISEVYENQFSTLLSESDLKSLAYDFLSIDFPSLSANEVHLSGHGGSMYAGIDVKDFHFKARDTIITLYENGVIESIRYIDSDHEPELIAADENQLKLIAQDYLESHHLDEYVFKEISVHSSVGRVQLTYHPDERKDYENFAENIEIIFENYYDWVLSEVRMPDPIYPYMIIVDDLENAYAQREYLEDIIRPYFDAITKATFYPSFNRGIGNVSYRWLFYVEKNQTTYIINLDASDHHIISIGRRFNQ